ncbi:MAG: hypothetical protein ACLR7D_17285 [Lachnospira eligens]
MTKDEAVKALNDVGLGYKQCCTEL